MKKLKPRKEPLENDDHETFCNEYLVDFRRQAAYKRTYGYDFSEKTNICALANQVLKRPEVQARIAYLKKQKFKKVKLTKDYVIEKWTMLIEDENVSNSVKLKTINAVAEHLEMIKTKVDLNATGKLDHDVNVIISWEKSKKQKEKDV